MPYPDWIEGKQQFNRVESIASDLSLSGVGIASVKLFSGSGEIITGSFAAWRQPDVLPEDDNLQLFIDGVFIQHLSWGESCSFHMGSWVSAILPSYYDGGNLGFMNISKASPFSTSLEFKYSKTIVGTTFVSLRVTLGIY